MFLVHNERTKLTANLFNALAASLVAAGVFAPAIAFLYGLSRPVATIGQLSVVSVGCVAGGAFLHCLGRRKLGRLRMSGFAMHLLLAPVLAVIAGLFIYWLTDWMDRRDARQHHPAE